MNHTDYINDAPCRGWHLNRLVMRIIVGVMTLMMMTMKMMMMAMMTMVMMMMISRHGEEIPMYGPPIFLTQFQKTVVVRYLSLHE